MGRWALPLPDRYTQPVSDVVCLLGCKGCGLCLMDSDLARKRPARKGVVCLLELRQEAVVTPGE